MNTRYIIAGLFVVILLGVLGYWYNLHQKPATEVLPVVAGSDEPGITVTRSTQ